MSRGTVEKSSDGSRWFRGCNGPRAQQNKMADFVPLEISELWSVSIDATVAAGNISRSCARSASDREINTGGDQRLGLSAIRRINSAAKRVLGPRMMGRRGVEPTTEESVFMDQQQPG